MSGLWGQNSWGWGGGRGKGKGNGRGWGYQGNAGWGSFQQGASYGGGRGAGGGLGFGGVARQFQGMCEDMNAMACMAQVGQALNGLSAGGGTTPASSGAASPAKEPEALTESAVEKAVKKAIADSPSKDDEARLHALAGRWSITSGENTRWMSLIMSRAVGYRSSGLGPSEFSTTSSMWSGRSPRSWVGER